MRIGENTTQNYQSILQMLKNLNKNTRNDPLGIFHSNFGMNQPGQGSRPPGPGGPHSRLYPRRPPYRCGGSPVRPGGADRPERAGGRHQPYLFKILRGEVRADR